MGTSLSFAFVQTTKFTRNPVLFSLSKSIIKSAKVQIPRVLYKLGARSILVDQERVSIYTPGLHIPGFPECEFIIYRVPNPTTMSDSVFINRSSNKDQMCKINDRLWMTDY